jgi:DNA polymerase III sliding clamp (beta) subunit (PCNA family)
MAFTIPARAIRRIEGNVLLAIDKQQAAMVTADGTTITSRLIDGTYPNVQQLIPEPSPIPSPANASSCYMP